MYRTPFFRSPWSGRLTKRVFLLVFAALTLLHFPFMQQSRAAAPSAEVRQDVDALWATIDEYLEHERQAARVPGVALAIVRGDQVVHLQGFGQADPSGRAVTAQTPFLIGSTSKSFTAVAIMQLTETGQLDLDAPVQRYLPWFRVADAEASARITVRHLLNHTSGLPRSVGIDSATSRDMRDQALEEHVRALRTAQLTEPVGATWQYSNAGYMTLGLIVQAVSGQSYESYLQQHIFGPLEMERSFTDLGEAREAGLAAGYRYWFGRPVATDAPFNRQALPAGFLMSSAEDMAHYLIAQLNDGRYGNGVILAPAGLAELQRGAVSLPGEAYDSYERPRYGMGWFSGSRNGLAVVGHSGDAANFHANMILAPESGYGILLLMNASNRLAGARMRGIADGVLNLLHGQQPPAIQQDNTALNVFRAIMALAILLALALIRSVVTVRRYARRAPGTMSAGWLGMLRHAVAPLVLFLLPALVLLLGPPTLFRYPWPALLLFLPDLATVALVSGVAALGWAVIRTAVMYRLLRKAAPPEIAPLAAPARRVHST